MSAVEETDFEPRGVLVIGPDGARCSGVLLTGGGASGLWVLTTSAAFGCRILRKMPITTLPVGQLLYPSSSKRNKLKFSVVYEKTRPPTTAPVDKLNGTGLDVPLDLPIVESTASVAAMWRCALLSQTLDRLFKKWELSSSQEQTSCCSQKTNAGGDAASDEEFTRSALPLFLLLRLKNNSSRKVYFKVEELLSEATSVLSSLLSRLEASGVDEGRKDGRWWRGRRLMLESCPFGNTIFFNAWSEGIAGGATGRQGCVLMADIRAAPSCEGAPVFLVDPSTHSPAARPDRRVGPVALTVAAMSWWRGEWVGFTLLASLPPVLRDMLKLKSAPAAPLQAPPTGKVGADVEVGVAAAAEAAVVLVRCGGDWGSGVAVALPDAAPGDAPAPRLVLTCSHVVRHSPEPEEYGGGVQSIGRWGIISVWWRGHRLPARMLFRSPAGEAFDIAVLQLLEDDDTVEKWPTALPLASTSPTKGDRVLCAGFPLVADTARTGPLVTGGRVAKVNRGAMLQASCIAHAGASGGALLRPRVGGEGVEVVGVVVSNIRDETSGMLFPHFCLAIPSDALYPPLCDFMSSADVTTLKALTPKDAAIKRLWLLQAPNSKPALPLAHL